MPLRTGRHRPTSRTRMSATVATLVAALLLAAATPAGAATAAAATTPAATQAAGADRTWTLDLADGEAAGVVVRDGVARLASGTDTEASRDLDRSGRTGLLTLAAHRLERASDRITATVRADRAPGTEVVVDVRGQRRNGTWTEWLPGPTVRLPEPVTTVQPRLALFETATPRGTEQADGAAVRELTLTARPARPGAEAAVTEQGPRTYRVFATREGLVGGTTANGHVIRERDLFVALPSRRALAPRGTSDYAVKVCAPNGRCAFAPVWDVGPWNIRDDYWNPSADRQQWRDLPQGLPQAQAAHEQGHNGGNDGYGRRVLNPAGIDLADGLFWDVLGLTDNEWVNVEYLWTGSAPLAQVKGPVDLRAAPDAAAAVVGKAANRAAVPVQCLLGGEWLRIGTDQYLPRSAVGGLGTVAAC